MKSKFLKAFVSAFLFTSVLHAGGSSVAGVGAPQFIYSCYELNFNPDDQSNQQPPDFEVTVGKFWPKYELTLSVINRKAKKMSSELTYEKLPSAIGSPVEYISKNYQLLVNGTTTPIYENGHIYHYSQLTYHYRPYRELKCERVDKD